VHTDPKIGPVLTFENAIDVPRAKLLRCQVISDQDGHLTLNCGHFVQCLTVGRWTSWRHSARGSTKSDNSAAWGMLPEGCEDGVHFLQIDGSQADAISVPNGGELRVTSINC